MDKVNKASFWFSKQNLHNYIFFYEISKIFQIIEIMETLNINEISTLKISDDSYPGNYYYNLYWSCLRF